VEYNAGKNDAWDFEKWNDHACGHFIFPNVPLVFSLYKCTNKYTRNIFGGFYIINVIYHVLHVQVQLVFLYWQLCW
jgi:hypothetical protein